LRVVTIVQPETLVRWHRAGFRCYWRWKSRLQGGRPQFEMDLHVLAHDARICRGCCESLLTPAMRPA
jgi:hypothetical protein